MPETRTRIKICGITNAVDTHAAIHLGADALGFIFVQGSPRYVGDSANILQILRDVPPFVTRVGVCVNVQSIPAEALSLLDVIQTYGPQVKPADFPSIRTIPAIRVQSCEDLDQIVAALEENTSRTILLDAFSPGSLGGAGVTFDWKLAVQAKEQFNLNLILAGGLNAENVAEAIRVVRPYSVDVASGVEASPGIKNHTKLRDFIEAVRSA